MTTPSRHVESAETKGADYRATTTAGECCGPEECC